MRLRALPLSEMQLWLLSTILAVSATASCKSAPCKQHDVLPGANSQRLTDLFQKVDCPNEVRIFFAPPSGLAPGFLGLTTYWTQVTVIQIKDGLEGELRENAIAHELFHVELEREGYPARFPDEGSPADNDLAMRIVDCINHPMVNKRLRAAGWKPELLLRGTIDSYRSLRATTDDNNPVYQRGIGLQMYCLSVQISPAEMTPVEEALNKIQPKFLSEEFRFRSQLGDLYCGNPDDCWEQVKSLRKAFGSTAHFTNPKTGKNE